MSNLFEDVQKQLGKKVFYLGFYAREEEASKRFTNIAALRKIDYTVAALSEAGYEVELISPSWNTKDFTFEWARNYQLAARVKLSIPPSFYLKGMLSNRLNISLSKWWFVLKCTFSIPRNSVVIVYHSPKLFGVLNRIKKWKPLRYALEIGEVYGDVWDIPAKDAEDEQKLFELCDYFIPVSKELHRQLAPRARFLMHGNYKIQYPLREPKGGSKVRSILYAGSLDETKGATAKALELMKYLPDNYRLHIAGYGDQHQIDRLNESIQNINSERGLALIQFHGKLNFEEQEKLMRSCEIAINPQLPGVYMKTAFPSKVLVYLSYQLNVVSTEIESVVNSAIAPLVTFVDGNTGADFARGILGLKWEHINQIPEVLDALNEECIQNFKELIES